MSWLFVLFIVLSVRNYQSIAIKSINLTTTDDQYKNDGVNITLLKDTTVDMIKNEWHINTTDNAGFQIQIDLDNSWGFHPNKLSKITFIIYSNETINVGDTDNRDLLISISVGNNEYLSMWLAIDRYTWGSFNNRIYPNCSQLIPKELEFGNVKNEVASNNGMKRSTKAFGYLTDYEQKTLLMKPSNEDNDKPNSYPLIITLENDAINNMLFVSYTNPNWLKDEFIQKCVYNSFQTEEGLQIYIASDDKYAQFRFNKFYIQYDLYEYNITTSIYTSTLLFHSNSNINSSEYLSTNVHFETSQTTSDQRIPHIRNDTTIITIIIIVAVIVIIIIICACIIIITLYYKGIKTASPSNKNIELSAHDDDDGDSISDDANKNIKIININHIEQSNNSNDTDCESLYESQHELDDAADTKTNEGENIQEYQSQNEYIRIENILKNCENKEWQRYLFNFKQHKINDYRLKHFINDDNKIWQQLVPEHGVRVEFISLWKQKTKTSNNDFQDV